MTQFPERRCRGRRSRRHRGRDDFLDGGNGNDGSVGRGGGGIPRGGAGADTFGLDATAGGPAGTARRDLVRDSSHAQGDRPELAVTGRRTSSLTGGNGFGAPGRARFFPEGGHAVVEADDARRAGGAPRPRQPDGRGFSPSTSDATLRERQATAPKNSPAHLRRKLLRAAYVRHDHDR